MATAPIFFVLLYLIALTRAASTTPRLSREVASFVPSCAEPCLLSFLAANYNVSGCGSLPSLRCLCSTVGLTEFTLGEGAVQCITAERRFGSCPDNVANSELYVLENLETSTWI